MREIKRIEFKIGKSLFPEQFKSVINFSPFDFSKSQEDEFIEALTCALDKVQPSDFQGFLQCDDGIFSIGIESGEPFKHWIDDEEYEYDEDTNSLKKRKNPSEEYIAKVYDFRSFVEPVLEILEPKIPNNTILPHFAEFLGNISLILSVDLELLEDYTSEEDYSTVNNAFNGFQNEIDELLNTNNIYIQRFAKCFVTKVSKDFIKITKGKKTKLSVITDDEIKEASGIVEKIFTKLITPKEYADRILLYCYVRELKRFCSFPIS